MELLPGSRLSHLSLIETRHHLPLLPNNSIKNPSSGVVEVPGIYKGQLPKGGAGRLLERLLRAKNIRPTKELTYKNIAEPSVIEAHQKGMDPAKTVLGKQGERVLAQYNLKPKSFEFKVVNDKLDLIIKVK
jgi:hypothetical protein